jgi:limonene-1,2-epoxide hydrolase
MKNFFLRFTTSSLSLAFLLLLSFHRIYAQGDMHVQNANSFFTMNPDADEDINMATDFLQALLVNADFDKAKSMLADSYMDYGPGASDSVGTDQMIAMQQKMDSSESNWNIQYVARMSIRVPDGNLAGDWVFLWMQVSSLDKLSGKTITMPAHSVFKIVNGKIVFEFDYFDNLSALRQMGYTITPPQAMTSM